MKKYILSFTAGLIIILTYHAYAQKFTQKFKVDTGQEAKPSEEVASIGKPEPNPAIAPLAPTDINSKAIKNFKRSYKDAADASWYAESHALVATFTQDGIKNRVVYNKNGSWRFTVRSYEENKLPKEIRSIVKPVYYDYNITAIQEARVPDVDYPVYLIHIQDENCYKIIRVANGEMDVYKAYNKR